MSALEIGTDLKPSVGPLPPLLAPPEAAGVIRPSLAGGRPSSIPPPPRRDEERPEPPIARPITQPRPIEQAKLVTPEASTKVTTPSAVAAAAHEDES